MTKLGPRTIEEPQLELVPSPAVLDPHVNLAAAILATAFKDLASSDPIQFLDALSWLLFSDDPALFLQVLELDNRNVLTAILGGGNDAIRKPVAARAAYGAAARARRDGAAGAAALPEAAGGAAAGIPRIRGQRSAGGERTAKAGRGEV